MKASLWHNNTHITNIIVKLTHSCVRLSQLHLAGTIECAECVGYLTTNEAINWAVEEKGVHKFIEHDIVLTDHDYSSDCVGMLFTNPCMHHVSRTCHMTHYSGEPTSGGMGPLARHSTKDSRICWVRNGTSTTFHCRLNVYNYMQRQSGLAWTRWRWMPALYHILCRCCGNRVSDGRECRRLYNAAVQAVLPISGNRAKHNNLPQPMDGKSSSTADNNIQYLRLLFRSFWYPSWASANAIACSMTRRLDIALADLAALTAVTGFPQDCY